MLRATLPPAKYLDDVMAFVTPIAVRPFIQHQSSSAQQHRPTCKPKRIRRACIHLSSTHTTTKTSIQRYHDTFTWRGHRINYRVEGPIDGEPVLLIHGFGASINHWRNNVPALVDTGRFRVFAIDLLGFGASDKASPKLVEYGLPLWKDLVCDFIDEMGASKSWSLIGNSIGSLLCLMVAKHLGRERTQALCLINCAGGLVSFRYSELNIIQKVILWLFNTSLFNRYTGPAVFGNLRTKENLAKVLEQIYINREAISDELLDILCQPALDDGACEVFLAVLNADSGPAPEPLLSELTWCPTLVIWGDKDPWTPLKQGLHPGIKFNNYHNGLVLKVVENAGHCVHDECPDKVNEIMVPFLLEPKLLNAE